MIKLDGGFIQNLGRVYGLYTLGFLGFVILMAIFEAAGVSNTVIGWLFVAFTVGIYAMIGVCLLYTSPSPRDATLSRMPSSA